MSDVKTIVGALGRRKIAGRLDVTDAAVGNALMDGRFPAHWYAEIAALCAEDGIGCPMSAFRFSRKKAGATQ
jgi:hypothetical protein